MRKPWQARLILIYSGQHKHIKSPGLLPEFRGLQKSAKMRHIVALNGMPELLYKYKIGINNTRYNGGGLS